MSAKITAFKVQPEDLVDLIDMARVASAASIIEKCPGGRYIMEGYVCIHCGVDTSPETKVVDGKKRKVYPKCGAPRENEARREDLIDDLYGVFPPEG